MNIPAAELYIFDVDGTLRWTHEPGARYPLANDGWSLMPNVARTLSTFDWSGSGPKLALASNQSGVAEGLLSADTARGLIAATVLAAIGHIPADTRIEMCVCRDGSSCQRHKPNPRMLLDLVRHFGASKSGTIYVGDQAIDAEAARRADVRFMWARDFFGFDNL
jgi:D-glycero-D-manno-heptose 1,7-bisphosphate phosphatase